MSTLASMDLAALMKQFDEEMSIITLVTGTLADGSKHYAYVAIPPSKYQPFKEAEAKGNYDLADFGKILRHGPGLTPPDSVKKELEETLGVNHRFEEDLLDMRAKIEGGMLKAIPKDS